MKIWVSVSICVLILFSTFASALADDMEYGRVEISFDYNRADRDYANNQFAVWIEDLNGNLMTTVFVTRFTATRGWELRKEALPTWREKAGISTMQKDAVDSMSGATPKAQRLLYTWAEQSGDSTILPAGAYNYFVECNYFWEDTVLYSGTIRVGKKTDSNTAVARYSTESAKKYNIIENVTATFIPQK